MNASTLANEIIAAQSTEFLVDAFDATEADHSPDSATARGWIMDELERRDAAAFDAWLEANEGSPRRFYAK